LPLLIILINIGVSQEANSDTTDKIRRIYTDSSKTEKSDETPLTVNETEQVKKTSDKKISITFDNLPGERIYTLRERQEINDSILAALKEYDVPGTGFVVGEYVEGEDWEIIVRWLDEGHAIGFHNYSGQDIFGMPLGMFIEDIIKGKEAVDDLVTTYKQPVKFFRFPFLHYAPDARSKEMIIDELISQNVRIAHVSIVTEDFVYNMSLEKTLKTGDSLDIGYLRDEYIAHVLERLAYYEGLANEVAGRPIRHIIQFRTNRLNAMFLDEILSEFADKGYQFISLRDALRDRVYRKEETYYGEKGLSYLGRIRYSE
jgi:peptidoglycan/xylan/chitin deacetylase (PgdA/CDA1 family)